MDRKHFITQRSIESSASPQALLDRIRTPATWPDWQSEILSVEGPERVAVGDVVAGKAAMLGFEVDGQSHTVSTEVNQYVEEVVVGVGMRVTYAVEETGRGTRLTHRLECELPGGPLGSVLSFFLKRRFKKMERELLQRLAGSGPPSETGLSQVSSTSD